MPRRVKGTKGTPHVVHVISNAPPPATTGASGDDSSTSTQGQVTNNRTLNRTTAADTNNNNSINTRNGRSGGNSQSTRSTSHPGRDAASTTNTTTSGGARQHRDPTTTTTTRRTEPSAQRRGAGSNSNNNSSAATAGRGGPVSSSNRSLLREAEDDELLEELMRRNLTLRQQQNQEEEQRQRGTTARQQSQGQRQTQSQGDDSRAAVRYGRRRADINHNIEGDIVSSTQHADHTLGSTPELQQQQQPARDLPLNWVEDSEGDNANNQRNVYRTPPERRTNGSHDSNPRDTEDINSPEAIAAALRRLHENDGVMEDQYVDSDLKDAHSLSTPNLDALRQQIAAQEEEVQKLQAFKKERDELMQSLRALKSDSVGISGEGNFSYDTQASTELRVHAALQGSTSATHVAIGSVGDDDEEDQHKEGRAAGAVVGSQQQGAAPAPTRDLGEFDSILSRVNQLASTTSTSHELSIKTEKLKKKKKEVKLAASGTTTTAGGGGGDLPSTEEVNALAEAIAALSSLAADLDVPISSDEDEEDAKEANGGDKEDIAKDGTQQQPPGDDRPAESQLKREDKEQQQSLGGEDDEDPYYTDDFED